MELGSLGTILTGALTVGSGGIFGLFGSAIGVVAKFFQEKQRQEWEKKKWDHETTMLKLNMEAQAKETEQELAIVAQEGSWKGLSDSLKADASITPVHPITNDLKCLFRPFLTVVLWILAAYVFYMIISGGLKNYIETAEAVALIKYMVHTVFFAASTATVWWFGDRALAPPGTKNK